MPPGKKVRNTERELTLIGHLDELRMRLIICVAAFVVAVTISFFFSAPVLTILIKPVDAIRNDPSRAETVSNTLDLLVSSDGMVHVEDHRKLRAVKAVESLNLVLLPTDDEPTTRTLNLMGTAKQSKIIYSSPLDPFLMKFKVALVLGVLLSLFVWVWQIWLFIAPGLTDKEKLVIRPLLMWAIFLFPAGALFAYAMLFFIIQVMQRYIVPGIDILYNVQSYLKLTTTLMIVFGIIFELPLIIAMLARIGVVTPAFLRHYRKHSYVGLAFAAMIITPTTDPFTMLIALGPLIALYEISILISVPMTLMRTRAEEEDMESEEVKPA